MRQARFAEAADELPKAIALLSQAIEDYPQEVMPLSELLRIHRSRDTADDEVERFRSMLLSRLLDPDLPLATGSVYFVMNGHGDDPEVLGILEKAIVDRLSPQTDLELLKVLAVVQGRLGKYEESRATLDRVMALDASFSTVSTALYLDMEGEHWESALDLLESVRDDPELAEVWKHLRIQLLAKTGSLDELDKEISALQADRQQGELSSYGVHSLLAQIAWDLYDRGEMARSEIIWREILAAYPDDLEARRVVANLFSDEQERIEQEKIVDQKLAAMDDPDELLTQGTNYLAAGDDERAFELLSRAAPMSGDSEAAWFNLGLAADRLERWPDAADAYQEAYKLNQLRPETQLRLAAALVALGRCAEAIPFFESGLALDPGRTVAYYYLSGCYQEQGRSEDAAKAMAEYDRRSQ